MNTVDLSKYDNSYYKPGKSIITRTLWYFVNALFFNTPLFPFSKLKVFLLRLFGAKIGKKVIIKPSVNIKYPWRLTIGDNVWIGEKVWIDNLANITIYNNVCISQGALLLCGNHNYKKTTFDLLIAEITIQNGVWIGAKAIITGGVTCYEQSILTVGSVTSKNLKSNYIYRGNPAIIEKKRNIIQ